MRVRKVGMSHRGQGTSENPFLLCFFLYDLASSPDAWSSQTSLHASAFP